MTIEFATILIGCVLVLLGVALIEPRAVPIVAGLFLIASAIDIRGTTR